MAGSDFKTQSMIRLVLDVNGKVKPDDLQSLTAEERAAALQQFFAANSATMPIHFDGDELVMGPGAAVPAPQPVAPPPPAAEAIPGAPVSFAPEVAPEMPAPFPTVPEVGLAAGAAAGVAAGAAAEPDFGGPAPAPVPDFPAPSAGDLGAPAPAPVGDFGGPVPAPVPDFGVPTGEPVPDFGVPSGEPVPDFGVPAGAPVPDFGVPAGAPVSDFGVPADSPVPDFGVLAPEAAIEGPDAALPSAETPADAGAVKKATLSGPFLAILIGVAVVALVAIGLAYAWFSGVFSPAPTAQPAPPSVKQSVTTSATPSKGAAGSSTATASKPATK